MIVQTDHSAVSVTTIETEFTRDLIVHHLHLHPWSVDPEYAGLTGMTWHNEPRADYEYQRTLVTNTR